MKSVGNKGFHLDSGLFWFHENCVFLFFFFFCSRCRHTQKSTVCVEETFWPVCEQSTLFWLASWENCCSASEAVHVCWWRQVKSVSLASRKMPCLNCYYCSYSHAALTLWHSNCAVCVRARACACASQTGDTFDSRLWCHRAVPPLCLSFF